VVFDHERAMAEESELRFEAAVSQLEEIVESLERGEPELATALTKYETGVRLLSRCYALLEHAERSVALLTGVDAEGNPITASFDAAATLSVGTEVTGRLSSNPTRSAKASGIAAEPKPARTRRAKPLAEPEPDKLEPPF
jgi:exodeoxyribonuclease VII small subunit